MKMKFLKKGLNKVLKRFGFVIINLNRLKTIDANKKNVNEKPDLLNTFYNLLRSQQYTPAVVFDIGANKGTWTQDCLRYFPNATYYLFEPQINLIKDINQLFSHKKNVHLYSVGVGNTNGELLFTLHERDDSCTFMLSEIEAKKQGLEQVKVPMVRLDDFVEQNNLKQPSILKIDAEGLDLEVLQGASKIVKSAEIIMLEVGITNKTFKNSAINVMNYLEDLGFVLFDITDLNRPFPNKALWLSEFVFIKKNGVLDIDYSK